jgi:hypothetical protein
MSSGARKRVAAGVALLIFAALCAVIFRGVGSAEDDFRDSAAPWQRGLAPPEVTEPGAAARFGEHLLGIAARADVQRAYGRYQLGLGDVIEGTVYPQTQARYRTVQALRSLRSSLARQDRARVDVAIGAILAEGAKTAGTQRATQLDRAASSFRRALDTDPENDEAKVDLEVLLRSVRDKAGIRGRPSPSSGRTPQRQQDPKGPVAPTEDEGAGF